jgi:secondary thiamine-phosphate synthase enzyme
MEKLAIHTTQRCQLLDITDDVRELVASCSGWHSGALVLFSPHTTCGLTINEGADPDVQRDMTAYFNKLVPQDSSFCHAEGNSDAHIKTALFGAALTLLIEDGELCLGRWQSIYVCENDGPRTRMVWAQFLPSGG